MVEFPERLKQTMLKRGWTLDNKLALASGIRASTLSLMLSGKTQPTTETLEKIAKVLEVSTTYLLHGDEPPPLPTRDVIPFREPIIPLLEALQQGVQESLVAAHNNTLIISYELLKSGEVARVSQATRVPYPTFGVSSEKRGIAVLEEGPFPFQFSQGDVLCCLPYENQELADGIPVVIKEGRGLALVAKRGQGVISHFGKTTIMTPLFYVESMYRSFGTEKETVAALAEMLHRS